MKIPKLFVCLRRERCLKFFPPMLIIGSLSIPAHVCCDAISIYSVLSTFTVNLLAKSQLCTLFSSLFNFSSKCSAFLAEMV